MSASYVANVGTQFDPDLSEPIMLSIWKEYEQVLLESLLTSFGLDILFGRDFFVKDQYGGDVDTIYNVRKIGQDKQMSYKNDLNKQAYEQRGEYIKAKYDKDKRFTDIRAEFDRQKKEGTLIDSYTGQKLAQDAYMQLDHVIATENIHNDRCRVLAGLSGLDLANCEENLRPTDRSINTSMQHKTMDEYYVFLKEEEPERIKRLEQLRLKSQSELTDKERAKLHLLEQKEAVDPERLKRYDVAARKAYKAKLERAYYTSPRFAKDLTKAAGKVGVGMGARQAVGFVFAEMWFAVDEESQNFRDAASAFDLGDFLKAVANALKRGFERAKEKYKELFSKFLSGAAAGALASLTTTLCNIFFTTAKHVVRIIRQCYASLVEAGKVLFINPENYTFGDRMRAVAKILATGGSVAVGVLVSEAVSNTGIKAIPELCDIVPDFCGTFVSGIMSCTLLLFLDRNERMNELFHALDDLHTIETEINYYRQQADYFERYAAELEQIDFEQFKKEIAFYGQISKRLEAAETEQELNSVLKNALKTANILMPWNGYESFDQFMGDKNAKLVFE